MTDDEQPEEGAPDGEALPAALPDAPAAPAPEVRSVDAWAMELFPPSPRGRQHPLRFLHGAAHAGHRWQCCKEHEGVPMQLTRADYEAAIEAAKTAPFVAHQPALYTRF